MPDQERACEPRTEPVARKLWEQARSEYDYDWESNAEGFRQQAGELLAVADAVQAGDAEYTPGRWWRVMAPDGSLWCETSDEAEVREHLRPGDSLERLYELRRSEWRKVSNDG